MALKQWREAARTAIIIAREEQNAGEYSNTERQGGRSIGYGQLWLLQSLTPYIFLYLTRPFFSGTLQFITVELSDTHDMLTGSFINAEVIWLYNSALEHIILKTLDKQGHYCAYINFTEQLVYLFLMSTPSVFR